MDAARRGQFNRIVTEEMLRRYVDIEPAKVSARVFKEMRTGSSCREVALCCGEVPFAHPIEGPP
jgi:hypothetical protein